MLTIVNKKTWRTCDFPVWERVKHIVPVYNAHPSYKIKNLGKILRIMQPKIWYIDAHEILRIPSEIKAGISPCQIKRLFQHDITVLTSSESKISFDHTTIKKQLYKYHKQNLTFFFVINIITTLVFQISNIYHE